MFTNVVFVNTTMNKQIIRELHPFIRLISKLDEEHRKGFFQYIAEYCACEDCFPTDCDDLCRRKCKLVEVLMLGRIERMEKRWNQRRAKREKEKRLQEVSKVESDLRHTESWAKQYKK